MGRHAEWRKIVKKKRRKLLRSALASKREELSRKEEEEKKKMPSYQVWIQEQKCLEIFRLAEEKRIVDERRKQWEEEERLARIRWEEEQAKLAQAKAKKVKQEMLIREEWEREQKKMKEVEEIKKKAEEAKKQKEEEILAKIDEFISGQGQFPSEADISTETQPGHPECPFFSKTGACRFKDNCSRNHIRPGISRVLLIPNFYEHLGLQTINQSEYDTDVGLEYEESETYQHFLDFYFDILPEFEACGEVTQLRVCSNEEPHLRGNVYIEYSKERYAMKAYKVFQGRFYAGKQLSVEFCNILSWKNAICGLYHVQKCPKGKTCNFLHVFWNPKRSINESQRWNRCSSQSNSRYFLDVKTKKDNWKWSDDSSGSENESLNYRSQHRYKRRRSYDSLVSENESTNNQSLQSHRKKFKNSESKRIHHSDRKKDHRKRKRSKSKHRNHHKHSLERINISTESDDSESAPTKTLNKVKNHSEKNKNSEI
uniref:Uncharacterized protein n=1 Tax=Clastoptera arizonana TaxID=38151 RepID=A0A1B6DJP7_9HEMI